MPEIVGEKIFFEGFEVAQILESAPPSVVEAFKRQLDIALDEEELADFYQWRAEWAE